MLLKSLLITAMLSVCMFAYDAVKVDVKWTGFKTVAKKGVPGTFDTVNLSIQKNDDFHTFLRSAKVTIDTASLNSNSKVRDNNITSTLFAAAGAQKITAMVKESKGDMSMGILDVEITMNEVSNIVKMNYSVKNNTLTANGMIDVLNFSMKEGFTAFATKCATLHAGKSWTNVNISFELPFTK